MSSPGPDPDVTCPPPPPAAIDGGSWSRLKSKFRAKAKLPPPILLPASATPAAAAARPPWPHGIAHHDLPARLTSAAGLAPPHLTDYLTSGAAGRVPMPLPYAAPVSAPMPPPLITAHAAAVRAAISVAPPPNKIGHPLDPSSPWHRDATASPVARLPPPASMTLRDDAASRFGQSTPIPGMMRHGVRPLGPPTLGPASPAPAPPAALAPAAELATLESRPTRPSISTSFSTGEHAAAAATATSGGACARLREIAGLPTGGGVTAISDDSSVCETPLSTTAITVVLRGVAPHTPASPGPAALLRSTQAVLAQEMAGRADHARRRDAARQIADCWLAHRYPARAWIARLDAAYGAFVAVPGRSNAHRTPRSEADRQLEAALAHRVWQIARKGPLSATTDMNGESTASAKPMWRGLLPGAAIHPEVLSRSIAGLPPALRAVAWTPDHLWALLAYLDALSQANDEAILGTQETGVPLSADPTRPEPTAEDIAMCASPLAPASTLLYFLDRCRQAGFRRRFLFHLGDVLVPVTCTPHELLRRRERVWRCVVALVTRCRINRQKVREAASAAAAASAGGVEATMTDVTAKSSTVMPTPNLTSSSPSSTSTSSVAREIERTLSARRRMRMAFPLRSSTAVRNSLHIHDTGSLTQVSLEATADSPSSIVSLAVVPVNGLDDLSSQVSRAASDPTLVRRLTTTRFESSALNYLYESLATQQLEDRFSVRIKR